MGIGDSRRGKDWRIKGRVGGFEEFIRTVGKEWTL